MATASTLAGQIDTLYWVTPRKVRRYVERVLFAGLVPFIKSSPGMGKSSIVRQIAQAYNLKLIDHRISTSQPEDLSGLPRFLKDKATFSPFDIFPTEDDPIPEGYDGWLLFLDEFNAGLKSVQAACYKLILDKMIGQKKLHPRCLIVLAGNHATDRSITTPISTAMQSRVIHINMQLSHPEWLEDIAIKEDYDFRIIAFTSQYPAKLSNFRPDHNDDTFACPRTWEFMNALIKGQEIVDEDASLFAGAIGSGMAVEFTQFSKVILKIIKIPEILADPEHCRLPDCQDTKWATVASMMEHITDKNFEKFSIYADRFALDMRVLFYRYVLTKKPQLRHEPTFIKAAITLAKYLNG